MVSRYAGGLQVCTWLTGVHVVSRCQQVSAGVSRCQQVLTGASKCQQGPAGVKRLQAAGNAEGCQKLTECYFRRFPTN